VGDLLNAKRLSWGWFQGGFAPTSVTKWGGHLRCNEFRITRRHSGLYFSSRTFLYFPQTANQHHVRPAKRLVIGTPQDKLTNHQYDLADFWTAVANGQLLRLAT